MAPFIGLEEIKPELKLSDDAIRHSLEEEFAPELNTLRSIPEEKKVILPETKLKAPIAPDEKINGVTRQTMGAMLAAGDKAVLEDIRQGVIENGAQVMQDTVRNEEMRQTTLAKKGEE